MPPANLNLLRAPAQPQVLQEPRGPVDHQRPPVSPRLDVRAPLSPRNPFSVLFPQDGSDINILDHDRSIPVSGHVVEDETGSRRTSERSTGAGVVVIANDINRGADNACVICHDGVRDVIFIPCGHYCCCSLCAAKIADLCPVCRETIKLRNRVYR